MANEVIDEQIDDTDDQAVSESTTSGSSESQESTDTQDDGAFDATQYEIDFGLPEGTLAGATDAEAALKIIRDNVDRTLVAGLGGAGDGEVDDEVGDEVETPVPQPPVKPAAKKDPAAASSGNAELEALKAKVGLLESKLDQQTKVQQENDKRDIERRVASEIDKWKSPKYGVGTARNFNQLRQVQELRALAATHVAGLKAEGKKVTPDAVEKILRTVRLWHDDTYKPAAKTGKVEGKAAVGTPGGTKGAKGDSAPRNIHEALQRTGR